MMNDNYKDLVFLKLDKILKLTKTDKTIYSINEDEIKQLLCILKYLNKNIEEVIEDIHDLWSSYTFKRNNIHPLLIPYNQINNKIIENEKGENDIYSIYRVIKELYPQIKNFNEYQFEINNINKQRILEIIGILANNDKFLNNVAFYIHESWINIQQKNNNKDKRMLLNYYELNEIEKNITKSNTFTDILAVGLFINDKKELYENINKCFKYGKEFIFIWSDYEKNKILYELKNISNYLQKLPPSLSYEGTDKQIVWRKSCWLACSGLYKPFFETEEEIKKFDGDLKDGLEGLKALNDKNLKLSLEFLKKIIDDSLIKTAHAVGITDELINLCTIRYRIIEYCENEENPGGIGLHPDGNALSSLITNGPGLNVFDFDGTKREPLYNGTIIMCGSTLYRWSDGIYLPTFHNVKTLSDKQKTSIVGFFNFPDNIKIHKKNSTVNIFYHDINKIKNDDKSQYGELFPLWSKILKMHNIIIPE